jgi:hypothetical protein
VGFNFASFLMGCEAFKGISNRERAVDVCMDRSLSAKVLKAQQISESPYITGFSIFLLIYLQTLVPLTLPSGDVGAVATVTVAESFGSTD